MTPVIKRQLTTSKNDRKMMTLRNVKSNTPNKIPEKSMVKNLSNLSKKKTCKKIEKNTI